MKISIIQIMGMPNDSHWQGHVLGLGSDGTVYVDDHTNCESGWKVYTEPMLRSETPYTPDIN